MSKPSIIAKLTTSEDKVAEMEAALATMCEAANEEAGLEIYSVHKDANNVGVYWFFELYSDDAALGVHGAGEQMKAAMGAMGSLLTGAPEIHLLTATVAKGLDL